MSKHPRWTPEDCERLRKGWGDMKGGIPALAASLGRSVDGIKIKASKMHLGPWLNASEYVTLNMLFKVLMGDHANNSYLYVRLLKLGLPVKKRRNHHNKWLMVRIDDFWKWAEQHQKDIDFSNFEEGLLGLEPDWAKQKRIRDQENKRLILPKKIHWSLQEDELLRQMCERSATWAEPDATFQRTSAAIRRRIYDLGCATPKRRPPTPWSQEEMETVAKMSCEGYSIDYIAKRTGKTGHSIRGKLEWLKNRQQKESEKNDLGRQEAEDAGRYRPDLQHL